MEQKLGYLEYKQVFQDNLDTFLISSALHVQTEENFYEDIIFKSFDVYQRSDINSIKDVVNLFHCFLWSMFKNKPSVEKNDDEILVNN